MKKILERDKKIRKKLEKFDKKKLILKMILNNFNFFKLVRVDAKVKLNKIFFLSSSISRISNRCVETINKKKFNKLTNFSRMIFLRIVRNNDVCGVEKSTW